jgi:hypothetical protein
VREVNKVRDSWIDTSGGLIGGTGNGIRMATED